MCQKIYLFVLGSFFICNQFVTKLALNICLDLCNVSYFCACQLFDSMSLLIPKKLAFEILPNLSVYSIYYFICYYMFEPL